MDEALRKAIEPEVRDLLKDVRGIRQEIGGALPNAGAVLLDQLERKLGRMLPPARATLKVDLDAAGLVRHRVTP